MNRAWWVPLTGVAGVVVIILSFVVGGGDPPEVDKPVQDIVDHYVDNEDGVKIGVSISLIGAALLLFFAGYLRELLRGPDRENSLWATVAFAGIVITATGAAIDSFISFALADSVEDIDPAAVQALTALWHNDFAPFVLGTGIFLFANGLAIVRTGALPKWLGWAGIVIGVIAFIPSEIAFISFPGSALWVLIASITATIRARADTPGASSPATPAV